MLPKFETLPTDELMVLRGRVLSWASDLWNMALDPMSTVPLGHDGYVKAWQLGDPIIDTCYILVDEAQDTNPVMLDVLKRQECQIVYVGDRHQQIYEWRGAINAMEVAETKHTLHLTKSFRFGQAIADFASDILATIGEKNRITGNEAIDSKLTREGQRAIICRTNAQILDSLLALDELRQGKSAYVVGGVDELVNCLEGVERLRNQRSSSYSMFIGFKDWEEFLQYTAKSGDTDAEKIVKLTDKYEVSELKSVLRNVSPSEERAHVILTTAHKSKGREWDGVELAEDFRTQPEKDEETGELTYNGPETRLFYVAATRAIKSLKPPVWALEAYGKKPVVAAAGTEAQQAQVS
jgi:superfamily I DNA/RNA helicase